jgi:DNA-binding transcriptional ArsR family regulator
MRALAHPARIEIVDHLNNSGAVVTATECAAMVGLSPSATSYHLRELAKYGLVEQAPSRGDGRERVWRSAGVGLRIEGDVTEPETREAERALVDAYLTRDFEQTRAWAHRQGAEPTVWREASVLMSLRAARRGRPAAGRAGAGGRADRGRSAGRASRTARAGRGAGCGGSDRRGGLPAGRTGAR